MKWLDKPFVDIRKTFSFDIDYIYDDENVESDISQYQNEEPIQSAD